MMLVLFCPGCATTGAAVQVKKTIDETPDKKPEKIEYGAIVVRAKRLTKLETLIKDAVEKNNRQTVEVAAGTAAAVAAFAIANSTLRTGGKVTDQLASLGVTAGAAYLSAFIAGSIYNMFTGKNP